MAKKEPKKKAGTGRRAVKTREIRRLRGMLDSDLLKYNTDLTAKVQEQEVKIKQLEEELAKPKA